MKYNACVYSSKYVQTLVSSAQVVIVTIRTGFPFGMAAVRRILLIARALQAADVSTAVIHMNTTGKDHDFGNSKAFGVHCEVPYLYASGEVKRPSSFLKRRYCTFRGYLKMCLLVLSGAISGRLKALYFYERSFGSLVSLMTITKLFGVRFILDLVESPVAMERNASLYGRINLRLYRRFALKYADRVSVISSTLLDDVKEIRGGTSETLLLPILADETSQNTLRKPIKGRFVLSLSPGYCEEIILVVDAFTRLSKDYKYAELCITGGLSKHQLERIIAKRVPSNAQYSLSHISCLGYIPQENLVDLYCSSSAAIVSLLDDARSSARMPTKIAEYANASLPIITGNIGDTSLYFEDQVSAIFYEPGNVNSLVDAMRLCMDSRLCEIVGRNGKEVARRSFSYKAYATPLSFFCLNHKEMTPK